MLPKIHCLLLILCVGAIQCKTSNYSQRKLTPQEKILFKLARSGSAEEINQELDRVQVSLTPDFHVIKHSLGLYVAGLERNLRLKEAPILTEIRLHVPDHWLNKFVDANPHLLKYLIQTLFMCLESYQKIDQTLYAITQKLVHRVQDYELHLHPNNQELRECVVEFNKFDQFVEHLDQQQVPIKRRRTYKEKW